MIYSSWSNLFERLKIGTKVPLGLLKFWYQFWETQNWYQNFSRPNGTLVIDGNVQLLFWSLTQEYVSYKDLNGIF